MADEFDPARQACRARAESRTDDAPVAPPTPGGRHVPTYRSQSDSGGGRPGRARRSGRRHRTGRVADDRIDGPAQVIKSVDGRDLFAVYRATCHGRTGVGDGPVVPALKVRPPDLTTLAKRNGGVFPGAQVGVMLSGPRRSTLPAHGSDEMPVWGPIFRAIDPSDSQAAKRVANLVLYLESLQVK